MLANHLSWLFMQQAAKRQESHLITETHTLLILLRLPVFVFHNINNHFLSQCVMFGVFCQCMRTSGIVSLPAYVIYYIIIYCILITDSVGAEVKQQKQRNTSNTLITVTDRLPESTRKALDTALQLCNLLANM